MKYATALALTSYEMFIESNFVREAFREVFEMKAAWMNVSSSFAAVARAGVGLLVVPALIGLMVICPQLAHLSKANAATNNAQVLVAAGDGNVAMLTRALQAGGSANASYDMGYNALILAAAGGQANAVRLLLEGGARVDSQSNRGLTALLSATIGGRAEVVAILLNAGANPDLHQPGVPSAREIAKRMGDAEIEALFTSRNLQQVASIQSAVISQVQ